MQIVIDLDEDLVKHIKENLAGMYNGKLYNAIRNGTPLPKGHGRLIDEDQIPGDGGWDFADRLMSTPTIIEAERSEEA